MQESKESLFSVSLLWLRILAGFGMAQHGYAKIMGGGMDQFVAGVTSMGFPAPEFFAWAAALSELLGGIFVAAGFLTRPAAFSVFITMVVAAFVAHQADPLQTKELALGYLTIFGMILFVGPGELSVDYNLCKNKCCTTCNS